MSIKRHLMIWLLAAVPVGLFVWWLSAVLWLPDLISLGAEIVIERCALTNRETVELTQQWVGDGYLTGIRHNRSDGSRLFTVGDGDAARVLRCRSTVVTNSGFIRFQFSGKEWRYYWGGRLGGQSLACGDGQTR